MRGLVGCHNAFLGVSRRSVVRVAARPKKGLYRGYTRPEKSVNMAREWQLVENRALSKKTGLFLRVVTGRDDDGMISVQEGLTGRRMSIKLSDVESATVNRRECRQWDAS